MKNRAQECDYIKGALVILIILGHTTASLGVFEKDKLLSYFSSLTVSFIMPLFLIITGYFIYSDDIISGGTFIRKKFRRMIIPAVKWGLFGGGVNLVFIIFGECTFIQICKNFYWNIQYLWYLYAVFICSVIVYVIESIIKNKSVLVSITIYVCITCFLLLIPTDKWNINFSFQFIMIGRLLRKYGFSLNSLYNNKLICIVISGIYFGVLLIFPYEYSVYVAGTNIITNQPSINHLLIDIFRFFVGVLGSVTISFILLCIFEWKNYYKKLSNTIYIVEKMGEYCMEIYCVQFIIVEIIFKNIIAILRNQNIVFTNVPYVCYFIWRNLFGFALCYVIYKIVIWFKFKKNYGCILF